MLIALALLAAGPADPATDPVADPKDPVVCRRERSEVGTHMPAKRVCMKKSDWDIVEKGTQNELQSLRERSSLNPGMAGTPR